MNNLTEQVVELKLIKIKQRRLLKKHSAFFYHKEDIEFSELSLLDKVLTKKELEKLWKQIT